MTIKEVQLFEELTTSGWVAELTKYHLNEEQLEELLAVYDLKNHPNREAFCEALNQQLGHFCGGLVDYYKMVADVAKNKDGRINVVKLSTQLRDKTTAFVRQSDKLLAVMAKISREDVNLIFGGRFGGDEIVPNQAFDELTRLLDAFGHYARTAPIQVERSTLPLVRQLVLRFIPLIEHFTGQKVTRELDPNTEKAGGPIHDFMATLYSYIPEDIKAKFPRSPNSFDKAIRDAIEEYKALCLEHGVA